MSDRPAKLLIYVVDDEAMLLDLAEVSLGTENYQIQKFEDPEEALRQFHHTRAKPALLITDFAMGKMNGLELIEKCKAVYPELKTILMSGTMGPEVILNAPIKVDQFIGKPYQPPSLAQMVQEILGEE